jgi:hypothetical protein
MLVSLPHQILIQEEARESNAQDARTDPIGISWRAEAFQGNPARTGTASL